MPSSSSTATVRRRPSHVRLLLLAALLLTAAPNIAASTNLFRGGGGGDDGHSDEPHLSPYDWRTRGRPTDRIIGGDTAESGRYPYSVSLLRSSHFCGGALIASNAVLTAAHCMDSRSIDEVGVRIGSDSRYSGTRYSIKSGHMHSDYKDSTSEYDMYIIILDGEVDIRTVKPVKVNPSPFWPQPGQSAVTMGWGTTVAGSTSFLPSTLRSVEVDVISNEDCEDAERNGEDYKGMVYDDMVCTSTSGKDACQGDSGGPLVIESSDGDPANDVLFGLVSWGIGCAFLPGVFARTSAGYDWIERVVCEENGGVGGVCGAATPEPSTASPSRTPTRFPTRFPTRNPTKFPTQLPTKLPTKYPSRSPTVRPTDGPTTSPTVSPSRSPSKSPTSSPTISPTTAAPTLSPTVSPTGAPSMSTEPTGSPSDSPSVSTMPTSQPSDVPSVSSRPSSAPSMSPSVTSQPSDSPTVTSQPSSSPSASPSISAVPTQSQQPSASPSSMPSSLPSISTMPSSMPSSVPSSAPSEAPSKSSAPTVTSSPTLSAAPSMERINLGNGLLISDQSALALGEDEDSSSNMSRCATVGVVLGNIFVAWLVF